MPKDQSTGERWSASTQGPRLTKISWSRGCLRQDECRRQERKCLKLSQWTQTRISSQYSNRSMVLFLSVLQTRTTIKRSKTYRSMSLSKDKGLSCTTLCTSKTQLNSNLLATKLDLRVFKCKIKVNLRRFWRHLTVTKQFQVCCKISSQTLTQATFPLNKVQPCNRCSKVNNSISNQPTSWRWISKNHS